MDTRIIVAKNSAGRLPEFSHLMDKTTKLLNDIASRDASFCSLNGTALENVVFDKMKEMCSGTSFQPSDIELKSGQGFPDIITLYMMNEKRFYGVEVKTTKENKWTSVGGSIVESTRIPNVDNIFMFFGKLCKPAAEFKCRPYEQCLSDIAVTHSPRYLIDMELSEREDIFSKMETDYESFRTDENNIAKVRKYYKDKARARGKTEMPWWMNDATSVNLSFISDLTTAKKSNLISRGLILFPEIVQGDYKRFALWLCSRHSVISPNVRDHFSAGGKCVSIDGETLSQPLGHIVGKIIEQSNEIIEILNNVDSSFLLEIEDAWPIGVSVNRLVRDWLNLMYEHLPELRTFEDTIMARKTHDVVYIKN